MISVTPRIPKCATSASKVWSSTRWSVTNCLTNRIRARSTSIGPTPSDRCQDHRLPGRARLPSVPDPREPCTRTGSPSGVPRRGPAGVGAGRAAAARSGNRRRGGLSGGRPLTAATTGFETAWRMKRGRGLPAFGIGISLIPLPLAASAARSSTCARRSRTSSPVEKPRPAPVIKTHRTLLSASASAKAVRRSALMATLRALSFSGRSMVISAMWSRSS